MSSFFVEISYRILYNEFKASVDMCKNILQLKNRRE